MTPTAFTCVTSVSPEMWIDCQAIIALSNDSVAENPPEVALIGVLSIADLSADDIFTYTQVGGDTEFFSLSGDSLLTAASFEEEAFNTYTIRVRSTDQESLWFKEESRITVADVNQATWDIPLPYARVAESLPAGAPVPISPPIGGLRRGI